MASPAAHDEVTAKRDKKKHKKRHRQAQVEDEEEEVIQASPPKKNKNKNKEKYTGAWLADFAKDQDRLYNSLKKTKMAHPWTFVQNEDFMKISWTFLELAHSWNILEDY